MGQRECFLMCCWKSSMNPGEKRSARLDGTDCTRRAMSAFTCLVNRVPIPATTFALASLGLGGTAADRNAVDDAFFASGLKDCAKRFSMFPPRYFTVLTCRSKSQCRLMAPRAPARCTVPFHYR